MAKVQLKGEPRPLERAGDREGQLPRGIVTAAGTIEVGWDEYRRTAKYALLVEFDTPDEMNEAMAARRLSFSLFSESEQAGG